LGLDKALSHLPSIATDIPSMGTTLADPGGPNSERFGQDGVTVTTQNQVDSAVCFCEGLVLTDADMG